MARREKAKDRAREGGVERGRRERRGDREEEKIGRAHV